MRAVKYYFLASYLLSAAMIAFAADTPAEFATAAEQTRYQHLLEQLRCLVCQNQTLADSHADLAQDLRNEVIRMIHAGKNDDAIRAFLVARYGEFVLYDPPFEFTTVLLWAGPGVLLLLIAVVWRRVAHRSPALSTAPLTETERAAFTKLTDSPTKSA